MPEVIIAFQWKPDRLLLSSACKTDLRASIALSTATIRDGSPPSTICVVSPCFRDMFATQTSPSRIVARQCYGFVKSALRLVNKRGHALRLLPVPAPSNLLGESAGEP